MRKHAATPAHGSRNESWSGLLVLCGLVNVSRSCWSLLIFDDDAQVRARDATPRPTVSTDAAVADQTLPDRSRNIVRHNSCKLHTHTHTHILGQMSLPWKRARRLPSNYVRSAFKYPTRSASRNAVELCSGDVGGPSRTWDRQQRCPCPLQPTRSPSPATYVMHAPAQPTHDDLIWRRNAIPLQLLCKYFTG